LAIIRNQRFGGKARPLTQGPTKRPCTTHLLSAGVSFIVIFSTSTSHASQTA